MDDSAFGLGPGQLARMLSIGRKASHAGRPEDETIAETLHETLTRALPLDVSASDSLPAILGRPCDELSDYRGRSAAELLADSRVDVAAFRALKDYSKELVKRSRSEVTRTTATTTYYAAIAAALAFHHERITQHSLGSLDRSFALLLDKPWLPPALRALFEAARKVCRAEVEGGPAESDT